MRTPEQNAKNAEYMREYRARMTPEQKEKHVERMRQYVREYRARMTPEQKAEASERRRKQRAQMTPEQRRKQKAKKSEYKRRRQTGIGSGLRDALINIQEGKCAICGVLFTGETHQPNSIAADHCHDSKQPRGLLCLRCNTAEGYIRKTGLTPVEFGQRLQKYLEAPPAVLAAEALALVG